MKCSRCGCEAEHLDSDGNHVIRLGCIEALKARLKELEGSLNEAIDRIERTTESGEVFIREYEKIKSVLSPYSIVVVHGDGTPVKVGEVPEPRPNGMGCGEKCPLKQVLTMFTGLIVRHCNASLDSGKVLIYEKGWNCKPGPDCPRGKE